MADARSPAADDVAMLMLGNEDLVSEPDTGYGGMPAPLHAIELDQWLELDHAAALQAIAPPDAPEPLA